MIFVRNLRKYERKNRTQLTILRLPEDDKVFRLTTALERAGYSVPSEILNREGYVYKRTRQVIDERAKAAV